LSQPQPEEQDENFEFLQLDTILTLKRMKDVKQNLGSGFYKSELMPLFKQHYHILNLHCLSNMKKMNEMIKQGN
jgi:hypothetical protein